MRGSSDGDDEGMTTGVRAAVVAAWVLAAMVCAGCTGDDKGDGKGDGTPTTAVGTLECQGVSFTPNSEDAATSVTASGLSCAEAEAFVRVAGTRTSSGGPQRVTVNGFRCILTRSVQDPLPQAFFECTDDDKKVTFVRT